MCGIAGLVDFSGGVSERLCILSRMTLAINHRGPDRNDVYASEFAGLGHARLSIIDLTESGNQPMHSTDGRYVIVYNGEIYNFRELRSELENEGVVFFGHSDTEVLLNAYARWGLGALIRFNGIFAFAVWDTLEEKLFLARDRFGVKPLYFRMQSNGIVFGSEIKVILASAQTSINVSPQALHEFAFFGVSLGTNTLIEGIHRLAPGHWLSFSRGGCEERAFWRVEGIPLIEDNEAAAVVKVRALVEAAVKRQLVSDVPVGIFLSGGIDSSAVTAFASRHYEGTISTYSVGFDFDRGVNELTKARRIAAHFGTDHHEIHLSGGVMPPIIENLIRTHDEPFSDAANIPLYLLCQKLNGNPRVVLQGDGGDEIFGGYRRYALLANYKVWKTLSLGRGILAPFANENLRRLHRILVAFAQSDPASRMGKLLTMDTSQTSFMDILSNEWKSKIRGTDAFLRYRQIADRLKDFDPVQQMLYCDTSILLPDVFLEKVDKSTMAFGTESRVPFMDNELTEYVMGLPGSMKLRKATPKLLLKKALRGIVPDDVLDGPKTGFGVPFSFWLATSLHEYAIGILEESVLRSDTFFDKAALFSLLNKHKLKPTEQSGFILWKALNLAIWQREYVK